MTVFVGCHRCACAGALRRTGLHSFQGTVQSRCWGRLAYLRSLGCSSRPCRFSLCRCSHYGCLEEAGCRESAEEAGGRNDGCLKEAGCGAGTEEAVARPSTEDASCGQKSGRREEVEALTVHTGGGFKTASKKLAEAPPAAAQASAPPHRTQAPASCMLCGPEPFHPATLCWSFGRVPSC